MEAMFSRFLFPKSVTLGLAATALIGVVAHPQSAQAVNLVPQQEGEIKLTNLDCLTGQCIELDGSIFASIVSEKDSSTGTYSYLFVDQKGTENTYYDLKNNSQFTFGSVDLGTTEPEGQFWFRPVAVNQDGTLMENGELEVGTFTFQFAKTLSELNLSFFDTEKRGGTSFKVFYADGSDQSILVSKGPNSNLQTFSFSDVDKITLNLGERYGRTGDGVNFQGTATVPEPSVTLGAIAAMVGGGILSQRRSQNSNA
jgi:hypothetical protein